MRHALVVGGTGMLHDVSLWLAERADVVTVIARDRARLRGLAARAAELGGRVEPVSVDYRDTPKLDAALTTAVAVHGPVDTCVAWLHSDAPDAPRVVARHVGRSHARGDFYHVLGSTAADPSSEASEWRKRIEDDTPVRYHEIVLGFVTEYGTSRWLTSGEIARGVIDAVEAGNERTIVGTVTPWEARP